MEPPNLYPVKLYVYDLSKGLARRLSPIMLGEGEGARWAGGREPGQAVAAGRGGETHGPEDIRKARVEKRVVCGGLGQKPSPRKPLRRGYGINQRWIPAGSLPRSGSAVHSCFLGAV
ncbi:hypothetical protein P7K49_002449 [Saguinus oedipus]|uniref:Desumoylating isopeptidase 1 n=1 Tax=Saguinus oedipus TaxID=9490 RepID=A0ABQ9WHB9_SAGOE|nr:hypothetical protein P7K49_002449 [Saguinus oedipus]